MPLASCNVSGLLVAAMPVHAVAACALHRTASGWGATFLAAALPGDGWGRCLPALQRLLRELPGFPVERLREAPARFQARLNATQ